MTQMFRKMAVNVFTDHRFGAGSMQDHIRCLTG